MRGIINSKVIKDTKEDFRNAKPYPHVVIDNFFNANFLREVIRSFPHYEDNVWFRFRKNIGELENIFEKGTSAISKPEDMPSLCKSFLNNLNSDEFCSILTTLTGIEGIRPDDHWHYSGLRVNIPGGTQLIHSDALFHPHLRKRKILTLMIYLTENWQKYQEGCLEMWDNDMTSCMKKIEPRFNRVCIFKNEEASYHGVTKNNHHRLAITMSYLLDESEETRR